MKDLSKLASKIEKNHMKRIAIEQFEIDPVDMARICDDFRDTWEFNFESLKKWWKFSRDNNRSVSIFRINFSKLFDFFFIFFTCSLIFFYLSVFCAVYLGPKTYLFNFRNEAIINLKQKYPRTRI